MNLIERINSLKAEQKIIAYRIEEIDNAREKLLAPSGIDYSKDPVKSSPQDLLAKNVADLVDKQCELANLLIENQKKMDVLFEEFEKLDSVEKEVMLGKLKGLSLQSIAYDVYLGKTTVWRIVKRIEERYGKQLER